MTKALKNENEIRDEINSMIDKYFLLKKKDDKFIPGKSKVNYAAAVYDENEIKTMVNSLLDGWFGMSKNSLRFESEFGKYLGCKNAIFNNSGSSANLLCVASFFSHHLAEDLRWQSGDEIITPALTFPTTINPLLQFNLKPVLLDVDEGTYNMSLENLEKVITSKTKGIMIPHTLGNPNDMRYIIFVKFIVYFVSCVLCPSNKFLSLNLNKYRIRVNHSLFITITPTL